MKKKLILLAIVIISILTWKSLGKGIEMQKKEEKNYTFILNEKVDQFNHRMKDKFSSEKYPIGTTFNKMNFHKQGTVELKVADSSLKFENPIDFWAGIGSTQKLDDISFSLGMSKNSTTSHEEAKAHMYEILEQIVDAGWKRYLYASDPRICGKEALTIRKDVDLSGLIGLDENYFMNFKEWFSLSTYHWYFYYKNEALMDVTLHRQAADKDLAKPGGYFLSIDVKSIEASFTHGYSPEKRLNWRKIREDQLEIYKKTRIEMEKEALDKGYHICTDYEEAPFNKGILPPVKKGETVPQKQKEPSIIIKSGELCPKSGLWQAFLPQGHPKAQLIAQSHSHTIHCAKGTHILKFGLSAEDEAQVRWKFISEDQESYDPNK